MFLALPPANDLLQGRTMKIAAQYFAACAALGFWTTMTEKGQDLIHRRNSECWTDWLICLSNVSDYSSSGL